MATLKVFGQEYPAANVLADLFTVPPDSSFVSSTIHVCNQAKTRGGFYIAVAVDGAADTAKQYLYFNEPIDAERGFPITIGMTLSAGDVVRVKSSNGTMSFNGFGEER